jgi:hypothetical protein
MSLRFAIFGADDDYAAPHAHLREAIEKYGKPK